MGKYIILPSSSDLNRGDQALVWETIEIAKNASCTGEFYMLASELNRTKQSQEEGINILSPILKHPSRMFKSKENNEYNFTLLLKWGIVAFFDLLYSLSLLFSPTRSVLKLFMSSDDKKTLELIEESDACFVKGGGFIHSAGKITDSYTVYFQLFHVLLAQSLHKPVYIMPNSFGPFPGFAVEWLVKKTLSKCKLVTVRESISKDMLDEISVESRLFPDLGFSLEKGSEEISQLIDIKNRYHEKKLVAITARPYRFPKSDNPNKMYNEYISSMVRFCRWLNASGYMPIFVEQVLSETTHENDRTAINEITSHLKNGTYEIVSDTAFNCRDIKNIYSQMDYTVGTRFHSVIFSLSEGVPALAIEYGGNKGAGILKDIGLAEYGIPIEEVSFNKLKETFIRLTDNSANIRLKTKEYMDYNQQMYKKFIDLIRSENH